MLKLSPRSAETFWLDIIPGVRIEFRPVTVAMMIIARRAGGDLYVKAADVDPDAIVGEDLNARVNVAVVTSLAKQGIVSWTGVGDAEGSPIEPSPDTIDMLLANWPVYEALDRLYVAPVFTRDAEKNG
jgi:hypothetical protein